MVGRGAAGPNLVLENPFSRRVSPPVAAPASAPVPANGRPLRAPAGEPSTGPRELSLRPMTGYEEDLIERRRNDPNTAALCNEILARCLAPPGGDGSAHLDRVRGLTVAERDAALLALRRMSLGDHVECEVDCPSCGRKNEVDFQLGELPVDFGPGFDPTAQVEHALAGGVVAVMRLPTAGDQERLLEAPPDTESERRTFLLASVLVRLGAEEGPFEASRVRSLGIGDRRALELAIEARTPDLDLSMAVVCSACGGAFSAPFDVAAFFLPR